MSNLKKYPDYFHRTQDKNTEKAFNQTSANLPISSRFHPFFPGVTVAILIT